MKTIVYTSFACLLKNQTINHLLQKNEHIDFSSFPQDLYVYPTGKSGLIPFELEMVWDSPFFKIVEKEGQLHIFLLDGIFVENVEIYSFSCGNVEISPQKIIFTSKSSKKILSLPHKSQNFRCGNLYNIIYVIFSFSGQEALVFYNTKENTARIFYADKINCEKEEFSLCRDDETRTLYIDKEGLKEKNVAFSPQASNPFLISTAFMERIKQRDFSSALSFLSSPLVQNQDECSLKEYFGDVSFIFTIDPRNIFALSNGQGKIFSFQILDGKIVDIDD